MIFPFASNLVQPVCRNESGDRLSPHEEASESPDVRLPLNLIRAHRWARRSANQSAAR
jgi:hypothetical protein